MNVNPQNQCCGSGPFWSDPDPGADVWDLDPGLNKWPYINFFGVCKSHKYFRNSCFLTFWFMTTPLRVYFCQKKFSEEIWPKIYLGQDPDPDVFESRIRDPQHCSKCPLPLMPTLNKKNFKYENFIIIKNKPGPAL
jgi:hypothetical protein